MINAPIFQIIIDTIPNPVIIMNGHELIKCNKNFLKFFNYSKLENFKEYNSEVASLFIENDNYFSLASIEENTFWTDYIYKNEKEHIVSMLNQDGQLISFELSINKLKGYVNHYIIVFTDITAIQNEKKLLEQMAYTDPLTKIYNRQIFDKLYIKELSNHKRYRENLSIIMFDLDYFKKVNDKYGHDIGDKVLVTITKLISKELRANDVFARWGGEEFIILLPRTNIDVAYDKAQELRQLIEQHSDKIIPSITASFGITELLDTDTEQDLFKRVDKALYQAKIKRNYAVKL